MWPRVLVLFAASRVALLGLGVLLTTQLGWHRSLAPWQREPWTALTGWDTVYYVRIAHRGYEDSLVVAFFPLYPLLIAAWDAVVPSSDAIASLVVANLATLLAMAGVYVLARDRLSERHARRAVLYLILSPYAFALAMGYSEGVFLALAAWLFVLVDRRREWWAVPLALAAGLTRVTGLALVPALLVIAWRRRTVGAWVCALAPLVAVAAHAAWLDHTVGDPLAMVHVQSNWGGEPAFPLIALGDQFWGFVRTGDVFELARGLTVLAYLALLYPILTRPAFREHRLEDVLYVAAIFAMPLLSNVLLSVGRFGLVAFPLFLALADIGLRRVVFHQAYVVFATVAQIIFFAAAALGYRAP